ncbi:chromobox protein homolog 3-like [Stylonychia lemnae]|uniref:Chromobox protein homolog 3-like n=1 Tax=Stylonychia lemnae TaxID=5949 RepID=A0A078AW51_STYLE|nr:chromobox protein homolog 3-like [Stylonychia lemnae]|eukprot:CDW86311.1 chromobox protein homolog 3-like [Stylonychia lemnae]
MAGDNDDCSVKEVCTVRSILGKRTNYKNEVQYLVQWDQYPTESTWELSESLIKAQDYIKEYEEKHQKPQCQAPLVIMNNQLKKRNQKLNDKKKQDQGAFAKGHQLYRVIGMTKSKNSGQLMCKVQWQCLNNGDQPQDSYVPLDILKQKEPSILLQYYEEMVDLLGNFPERYPLYPENHGFVVDKKKK